MDDNNLFLRIIEDRFDRFQKNYAMENGDFLSMEEQSRAAGFFRKYSSSGAFLYGGYDEAERRIPLFMPDYLGVSDEAGIIEYFKGSPSECPLVILEVKVPRQEKAQLTHRDYLGALMGDGIRREKIGDILVKPDGAQIVVLREMAEYLNESLTGVGRASVSTGIIGIDEIDPGEIIKEELHLNIPSPRLDNVVSAVFSVSRKTAQEAISRGLVFIDGIETVKADVKMKPGQKLVLRGKGKAIYMGVSGVSRKGRDYIDVIRYK